MNRRGFLGLLLSLPLVRSFHTMTAPVAPGVAVVLPDEMLTLAWQITERTVSYEAPGVLRTVDRYVASDAQWEYELMIESRGSKSRSTQMISKRPKREG